MMQKRFYWPIPSLLGRLLLLIFLMGVLLYSYLEDHVQRTTLQMRVPFLLTELQAIDEEIRTLHLLLQAEKDPRRLFALKEKSEFSHLYFPTEDEVEFIAE